jgi:hypothetical protein
MSDQVRDLLPHQLRVVSEKRELDQRLASLNTFFGSGVFAGLPVAEQVRLHKQAYHMAAYSSVLGERIGAF